MWGVMLSYTAAELAAMAQTTLPDLRTRREGDEVTPLDQPRLVTDGDVFGGRYVTGVLALEIAGSSQRH